MEKGPRKSPIFRFFRASYYFVEKVRLATSSYVVFSALLRKASFTQIDI